MSSGTTRGRWPELRDDPSARFAKAVRVRAVGGGGTLAASGTFARFTAMKGPNPPISTRRGNKQYEAGLDLLHAGAGEIGQGVCLGVGRRDHRRSVLQLAA